MGLYETQETRQFTFEAFAAHPFYTEVNRSLVQQALATLTARSNNTTPVIVDMACGTGAITRLVAEELATLGCRARIIGVDPSEEALVHAKKSMEEMGVQADFFQGDTTNLPALVQNADAIFFCNAIHLVPDKPTAFQHIAAILVPGGVFACNSAFYNGTSPEETTRFGRLWIRRAAGWLRKEHPEALASRVVKTTAMHLLTPDEYKSLLQEYGFCCVKAVQEHALMSLDGLRDLGHYWLFIEGALPGVNLTLGAMALGITVYQAGEELGMTEVPRLWLQIIATKG
ncbi:MAG TPA: class I SAM-dependent methyltransferase [Ktedonobacteraceae bacterium]|nr:class I SAM-dependent methyltransferase [Ktedonobacteraceae bacterium]